MHNEHVGFGPGKTDFVQAKQVGIFVNAREHRLALAFVLDAQQVDDVRVGHGVINIVSHAAAHLFKNPGHKGGWTAKGDSSAQLGERPNVRAGDAAVENVAENGDVESFNPSLFLANRERVKQRLSGMFVRAVTGIDHARVQETGKKMGRAGCAVADNDDVRV